MKRKTFKTNDGSLGHYDVPDDFEINDEPETTGSGGPLAPAGIEFEGESEYVPQYKKIFPDYNPAAGSGGPNLPGITLDDETNE